MGYGNPIPMTVPGNTLVVADTHGGLGQSLAGEEAVPARLRCPRQQARPDRMGGADERRNLSALWNGSLTRLSSQPELATAVDDA